jgi:hypothetical protein
MNPVLDLNPDQIEIVFGIWKRFTGQPTEKQQDQLEILNKSIEKFIEDQAFSPSYDLAPDGRGGWGGGGRQLGESYDGKKAWSSMNHLTVSDPN